MWTSLWQCRWRAGSGAASSAINRSATCLAIEDWDNRFRAWFPDSLDGRDPAVAGFAATVGM